MPPLHFPPDLETVLQRHVKHQAYTQPKQRLSRDKPWNPADARFFAKGLAKLSELFTSERTRMKAGYLDSPEFRSGYLLYFLPINFTKTRFVLDRLPQHFWRKPRYRILDLGSGPGTSTLAFLQKLKELKRPVEVELHLVDQNKNILKDAAAILQAWDLGEVKIVPHFHATSMQKFRWQERYDWIVFNHVLNEWVRGGAQERGEWLAPLLERHLHPEGMVTLIEPALKRPCRELMALRDHLMDAEGFQLLGPCLHAEHCPMLAATRHDWCHFYLDWEEPRMLQDLGRLIDSDNRYLKLAYLILTPKNFKSKPEKPNPQQFRVVSNRMVARGKVEAVLCGAAGRVKVSREDRETSAENHAFSQIRRGDLVELPRYQGEYAVDGLCRLLRHVPFRKVGELGGVG